MLKSDKGKRISYQDKAAIIHSKIPDAVFEQLAGTASPALLEDKSLDELFSFRTISARRSLSS